MNHAVVIDPSEINQFSSRKLWELLNDAKTLAKQHLLTKAITEELYRRGDFRPQGWSIPA